jgi:hypothetical protein
MKRIEDAFQALSERIVAGKIPHFNELEVDIVSDFYALWQSRPERRHLPMQFVRSPLTLGVRHEYGGDDLELLEKNNILATRPDGSFAMRDLMGPIIYLNLDRIKAALNATSWGVIDPVEGHFCVPDVPRHGIVPLAPTKALVPNVPSGRITRDDLARLNRDMASYAQDYFFANDLSACPGLTDLIRATAE